METLHTRLRQHLMPLTPASELDNEVMAMQDLFKGWLLEASPSIPMSAEMLARLVYEPPKQVKKVSHEKKALLEPKNCQRYFESLLFHDRIYMSPEVRFILESTITHLKQHIEEEKK